MINCKWDPEHTNTGYEIIDFASWLEFMGENFEEDNKNKQPDKEQEEQTDSQRLIKKMKGRDIYE